MSSTAGNRERQIETPSGRLTICALSGAYQFEGVVGLQKKIWGYGAPGGDDPYPERALFALAESGGLIALALLNERPVGFSAAWLGMDPRVDHHYLHSQLVGVLPGYRHLGIGYHLKLYQRDFSIHRGLDLVRWTFDPLLGANANLNLRKLGAVAHSYVPDFYGHLLHRFSAGVGSDRLWVDWHIHSPRVTRRLQAAAPPLVELPPFPQLVHIEEEGSKRSPSRCLRVDPKRHHENDLLVEIPNHFDTLRRTDRRQALRWRESIRAILQEYLERSYLIVDLLVLREDPKRHFYHLSRTPLQTLLENA